MDQKRYIEQSIVKDLARNKMVFIGGPRQVGKTTLAQMIGTRYYQHPQYLLFDDRQDRKNIIAQIFNKDADLIIFDELHKYRRWKNYLKALYDKRKNDFHILVTGSARLDVYRRGGDSLMGRYYYYRLHPFSTAEVLNITTTGLTGNQLLLPDPILGSQEVIDRLMKRGGFPEPFFDTTDNAIQRFQANRLDRLVREDIRDLEAIQDLSAMHILVSLLPSKIGSPLSLNALREDLEVSHRAISHWMEILERFYYHFRIRPYAKKTIRSLRKEPKMYLWDWSEIEDESIRFENLIASHLLKFCHGLYDTQGVKAELWYLRDVDGHEVDFLVTIASKPWFAVEVKLNDQKLAKPLTYFSERLSIPYLYQVILTPGVYLQNKNVTVVSADRFLSGLV